MAYTNINKPSNYFNTKLYTGNGATQSITGVGFQPDFLWLKDRSSGGTHVLVDVIRGSTKWLASDQTSGEVTRADQVTSFDSDGFSLGADSGNFINVNGNNNVAWNWLAGGTGVSNTDGNITSTVSANTTSGFSIVKYTGDGSGASGTIGHGLGVTPACVIMRPLNYVGAWWIAHQSMPTNYLLEFNTNAQANITTSFGGGGLSFSAFTNNVIGGIAVTTADLWNKSGEPYIAYCFAEKKGFSKFGSYTGNGNADGTFVYTGFKPAWFLVKRTDASAGQWVLLDTARSPSNPNNLQLYPSLSNADSTEPTGVTWDFLSNGIKIRNTGTNYNASGGTYIYMAFAEHPLVSSTGVPCTAR